MFAYAQLCLQETLGECRKLHPAELRCVRISKTHLRYLRARLAHRVLDAIPTIHIWFRMRLISDSPPPTTSHHSQPL